MHSLFDKINDRLFDSELPDIPIFFFFADDPDYQVWGVTEGTREDLLIGICFDISRKDATLTLIHEMIHVYLIIKHNDWSHGKRFKKWCRKAYKEFY